MPGQVSKCSATPTSLSSYHCYQAPAAKAGQSSHDIEGQHAGGKSTTKAAEHEGQSGHKEAYSSAKHVGKASIKWLERGGSYQVRGSQPGSVVRRIEVRADGRVLESSPASVPEEMGGWGNLRSHR